jgi:cystathionine gamma-synthase
MLFVHIQQVLLTKKVKELYYPKYTTPELYNEFGSGGYGGLFSIVLQTKEQARLFFDELGVYKGPSLGTNFTLACPYTLIAHYTELDWAESFGVSPHLIRISVGLEDLDWLLNEFTTTLNKLAS